MKRWAIFIYGVLSYDAALLGLFAITTTAYILIAIQLEERDLIAEHPQYAQYRERVPMLVPFTKRRQVMPA